jgi:hypothetical protein
VDYELEPPEGAIIQPLRGYFTSLEALVIWPSKKFKPNILKSWVKQNGSSDEREKDDAGNT